MRKRDKEIILGVIMLVVMLLPSMATGATCGDGICEGISSFDKTGLISDWKENWDNCPKDCQFTYDARTGTTYRTKEEIETKLIELVNRHPDIARYEIIGKSLEGKDILLFKMGNPEGGKFMFDGEVHGSEDCGTETGLKFFQWALESNDDEARAIREGNQLIFIPIINRDQYRRQNSRRNYTLSDGSRIQVSYGVDLNRNFPSGWGGSGSSDPTNNYDYRGISSGSEPETEAVSAAMKKYKPNTYFNVHCGMRLLYGDGNATLIANMITEISNIQNKIGSKTNEVYGTHKGGMGGGFVATTACSLGATCWLLEIAKWEEMPKTLEEYHSRWYHEAFPAYLAAAKTIQKSLNKTTVNNTTPQNNITTNITAQTNTTTSTNSTKTNVTTPTNTTKTNTTSTNVTIPTNSTKTNTTTVNQTQANTTTTQNNNSVQNVTVTAPVVQQAPPAPVISRGRGGGGGGSLKSYPYCGDKNCTGSEDCTNCEKDCGKCQEPEPISVKEVTTQEKKTYKQEESKVVVEEQPQQERENAIVIPLGRTVTNLITGRIIDSSPSPDHNKPFIPAIVLVIGALIASVIMIKTKVNENPVNAITTLAELEMHFPRHAEALERYVRETRGSGHGDEVIKDMLTKAGWPEHLIIHALNRPEDQTIIGQYT
ncbi:hypothetical protein JW826_04400 [Candidatus Woesearchaeota archaeon]|nr:hypothetical protein [Candidatus Woesearchaeota archaeon]